MIRLVKYCPFKLREIRYKKNIPLLFLDEFLCPKLCDFGLSKKIQEEKVKSGFKGTSAYVAPETWKYNDYQKAGDVYTFSLIAYDPGFITDTVDEIEYLEYDPNFSQKIFKKNFLLKEKHSKKLT